MNNIIPFIIVQLQYFALIITSASVINVDLCFNVLYIIRIIKLWGNI